MGSTLDVNILVAYAFGLFLIFIVARLLLVPLQFILRLIYNGLVGGVMLFVLNLAGQFIGLSLAINPVTALLAGFLGVPGIVVMLLVKHWLTL